MSLTRAYKFRLYPTVRQAQALTYQLAEACRLYNACLDERRDAWRKGHRVTFAMQARQIKDVRAAGDLGLTNADAAHDVAARVDRSFAAFFRRCSAGQRLGYPRFRSARRYDSITFTHYGRGARLRPGGRLYVHGVGEIRLRQHRQLEGEPKRVTIKREGDQWYAVILCAVERKPLPSTGEAVGIDVGLSTLAATSDGDLIVNPRWLRAAQAGIRIAARRVSRRVKGSRRRRKAVAILRRKLACVAAQRRDFHHKTARAIVQKYDVIAVEDLNIKGLAGGMLSKPVHDAGWGSFIERITEKAEEAARVFVRVNPRGTSQACSGCGAHVPKDLSVRQHRCPHCGLDIDRDVNAARNVLKLGLEEAVARQREVANACA
jgi:putative transposase